MGLFSAWQQYRQNQIDVARDQLRSGKGSTARRNDLQGRLQKLDGRAKGRTRGNAVGYRGRSGGSGSSREQRDLQKALKRYQSGRPGADRDLSRAMFRMQRHLGQR